jgi:hypothetical protein
MLYPVNSFVVRSSDVRADGWADRPLPFEPEGSMRDYRQALRRALADLDPERGAVLLGRYASRDTRRRDVENLLLYNLGLSAFAHLHPQEVVLTRSPTPAPPPEGDPEVLRYHHRYDLVASALPAAGADVIARLAPVPLRRPVTVEKIWYDVCASGTLEVERRLEGPGDQLSLDLTLHRPPGSGPPAMLGMIKVLVDGVVSALHRHDGSQVELLAERLSGRLAVPVDHVARRLTVDGGVLGRRKLLWPYRDFVQWNPADDAIARLRVGTMPSSTWLLSGRLTELGDRPTHPD